MPLTGHLVAMQIPSGRDGTGRSDLSRRLQQSFETIESTVEVVEPFLDRGRPALVFERGFTPCARNEVDVIAATMIVRKAMPSSRRKNRDDSAGDVLRRSIPVADRCHRLDPEPHSRPGARVLAAVEHPHQDPAKNDDQHRHHDDDPGCAAHSDRLAQEVRHRSLDQPRPRHERDDTPLTGRRSATRAIRLAKRQQPRAEPSNRWSRRCATVHDLPRRLHLRVAITLSSWAWNLAPDFRAIQINIESPTIAPSARRRS